jgi:hypothetical protein
VKTPVGRSVLSAADFVCNDEWGVGRVTIRKQLDHFSVRADPDTIKHSGTTTIYVQAKDKYDQDVGYDGDILVSASPSGYGELFYWEPSIASKTSGAKAKHLSASVLANAKATGRRVVASGDQPLEVPYGYANAGLLVYDADGTSPDKNTTVTFSVSAVDKPSAIGKGSVVIEGGGPNLNFPRYSQGDPRWKDAAYDHDIKGYDVNGNPIYYTIQERGCALCEMAWVLSAYGYVINPLQLNDWMNGRTRWDGGFDGSLVNWDAIGDLSGGKLAAIETRVPANQFGNSDYANDVSILEDYLNNGDLVIAEVKNVVNNKVHGHWVVVEPKVNGEYPIVDAGYGDRTSMEVYDNNVWSHVVVSQSKGK